MAQRRPKEAPAAPPEVEAPAVEVAPDPIPDGVLVYRQTGSDGNIVTGVQTLGGVQITEAQTLLELGIRDVRKHLGLDGQ